MPLTLMPPILLTMVLIILNPGAIVKTIKITLIPTWMPPMIMPLIMLPIMLPLPDSLILDYSLKRKIDPKSMIKQNNDSKWFLSCHQRRLPLCNQQLLHSPNDTTLPDATAATAENKMSARQLIHGQEHPVTKGDIIKKGFYRESAAEKFVACLHGIYQLPGCPRYTVDIIKLCSCLQLLPIDNNTMLRAALLMVDFRGMKFNIHKALYIHF